MEQHIFLLSRITFYYLLTHYSSILYFQIKRYLYTHVHRHICTAHMHTHMCTYTDSHIYTHVHTYACTHVHIHSLIIRDICTHMHIYRDAHIHMHIHIQTHTCIHTHAHTFLITTKSLLKQLGLGPSESYQFSYFRDFYLKS